MVVLFKIGCKFVYEDLNKCLLFFPPMSRKPLGGQGRLSFSRLHDHTLDTPQSVGLLWTRDQAVAETST